jgi:hypothetical protein
MATGVAGRRRAVQTVDEKIVRLFLKTVGSELGFYQAATTDFIPDLELRPQYQANLEIIRSVLKEGRLSSKELETLILDRYRAGERQALISGLLPKAKARTDDNENLLEDGADYLHGALFVRTAPSFVVSGDAMLPVSGGQNLRRESFTLGELLQHYYRRMGLEGLEGRRSRDLGALRYLLAGTSLDTLLFAIDFAALDGARGGVLKLEDYLQEAEAEVRDRRSRRTG